MSGIRYSVICASFVAMACAGGEELERSGDSGPRSDGAGTSTVGTGGPTGTGGSGGSSSTSSTGVGGAGGRGGTPATTGAGGAGGSGGAAGTGGMGTGGAGGRGGSAEDAAADNRVPIDAGTCTTCKLRVQYRASDTNARDNQIKPHFNIVNVGSTSVPLRELTIRYWYTADGGRPEVHSCDYAMIGCGNVTGRFVKLPTPERGADSYLEIGFTGTGVLAANGQTGEIQSRFNKDDYSNYDESDDYSFDPSRTSFSDWMRVTLYHNGGLVWGTDPSCADPSGGSACGNDGGVDASISDANHDVATPDVMVPDASSTDAASPDAATEGGSSEASADAADAEDSQRAD